MEPNLLRGRWVALAFAGLVAIAALSLVGSEEHGGLLDLVKERGIPGDAGVADETIEPVVDQTDYPSPELVPSPELLPPPSDDEAPLDEGFTFSSDEELIDEANGFDTTPMVVHEGRGEDGTVIEAPGETAIVEIEDGEL